MHALQAWEKNVCSSGSYAEPGQFTPPLNVPDVNAATGPSSLLTSGGRYTGPSRYRLAASRPAAFNSGVKSIKSLSSTPPREYGGGFVGIGWVGLVFSPGTSVCGTGFSSIGQIGWPVMRSNTKRNPCLVACATALIGLPFTLMSARSGAAGMSRSQIG